MFDIVTRYGRDKRMNQVTEDYEERKRARFFEVQGLTFVSSRATLYKRQISATTGLQEYRTTGLIIRIPDTDFYTQTGLTVHTTHLTRSTQHLVSETQPSRP
eukprot:IDg22118t1